MAETGPESLRALAPYWSLAGDEQLLNILQNTHQRLLSKCQETNCQLEQMASALNDASVTLQNINNQFMALSSSQFIESRVYDDDDVIEETPAKGSPAPPAPDELWAVRRGVARLCAAHEGLTLLRDSDSDTDSEDDEPARLVLRPRDLYADRPLPYIIGSQPWKNKWHAGLLLEDSDSGSSSPRARPDSQQYSQSEPEDAPDTHTTISEASSELPLDSSLPKTSPADVATEIARRLGGKEPPKAADHDPVHSEPARPAAGTGRRGRERATGCTVFPDEPPSPPPLSRTGSADSDIFAEIARGQPYAHAQTHDLFYQDKEDSDDGDIFSDFAPKPASNLHATPTSLFDAGPTPNMFKSRVSQSEDRRPERDSSERLREPDTDRVKKPVGGISLFGKKDTESIGAAILKRNQRKSSTSGEDSGNDHLEPQQSNEQTRRKEKDIFDDLFARSEAEKVPKDKVNVINDIQTVIRKKNEEKNVKDTNVVKPKVDLFSDNLFDDIDDIFSTNVVKMPPKDNTKSIFEDDDDLFSEIADPKVVKHEASSSNSKKQSIFDSDDDLFSDNIPKPVEKNNKIEEASENTRKVPKSTKINKEITESIFDDDEDDLFGDVKVTNKLNEVTNKLNEITKVHTTVEDKDEKGDKQRLKQDQIVITTNELKIPPLFDGTFTDSRNTIGKNNVDKKIKDTSIKNEDRKEKDNINQDSPVKSEDIVQSVAKNDNNIESKIMNKSIEKVSVKESNSINTENKIIDDVDRNIIEENNIDHPKNEHIKNYESISSDYSEQDFDDLPPAIDNNTTIHKSEATDNTTNNIFDNSLENDIFKETNKDEHLPKESEYVYNNTEIFPEFDKTESDNNREIATKTTAANIFSDILSEPPAFEKPSEPKKSKNVNALFDDDSDDESLFFKKNDVISDEKPEDFKPTQDRLFGLFTDVPPDVGFNRIGDDLDDDIFSSPPIIPKNESFSPIPSTVDSSLRNKVDLLPEIENDDIFATLPNTEKCVGTSKSEKDVFKIPIHERLESKTDDKQELFNTIEENNLIITPTNKLNFTNELLDNLSDEENLFASPLKSDKPTLTNEKDLPEHPDRNPAKTSDDNLIKEKAKPETILKQDSESKSDVDLFKKPELVKNSDVKLKSEPIVSSPEKSEPKKVGKLKLGLNINVNALLPGASPKKAKPNDQTDGQTQSVATDKQKVPETIQHDSKLTKSVGFEEKPESEILDNKLSKERAKIQVKRRPSTRRARKEAVRKSGIDFGEDSTDNSSSIDDPPKVVPEIPKTEDKTKTVEQHIDRPSVIPSSSQATLEDAIQAQIQAETPVNFSQTEIKPTYSKDVKSKVVYILNDEDIFNTPVEKTDIRENMKLGSENLDSNPGVSTLGQVYDQTKKKEKSLFNENDDAIFKGSVKKSAIFDSDSEEELFGSKRVEEKREMKREVIKGPLFGDDDDDDLFGDKTKTNVEPRPQTSRVSMKESPKTTAPVFEDPLSMFGDED